MKDFSHSSTLCNGFNIDLKFIAIELNDSERSKLVVIFKLHRHKDGVLTKKEFSFCTLKF